MTRLSLMDSDRARGDREQSATAPRSHWDIAWLGGRSSAPWVVLAVAVVLLIAVGGTVYAYLRPDGLGWGTRGYTIPSAREATLTFDLTKQPAAAASCDIVAQDSSGRSVGQTAGVAFPATPGGPRTVSRTVVVATTAQAIVVQVDTCRITSTG